MRIAIACLLLAGGCATAPADPPVTPANPGAFSSQPPTTAVANWVELGPAVPRDEFSHTIDVSDPNPFGELLVKATAGEPKISQLQIEYGDRTVYKVDLNRRMVAGDGQVIELRQRRAITKITVYTDGNSKGSFQVFGA
jgi:hypothetical protein